MFVVLKMTFSTRNVVKAMRCCCCFPVSRLLF